MINTNNIRLWLDGKVLSHLEKIVLVLTGASPHVTCVTVNSTGVPREERYLVVSIVTTEKPFIDISLVEEV